MKRLSRAIILIGLPIFFTPLAASAHEAYVLSKPQFEAGLAAPQVDLLHALTNPANLATFFAIAVAVTTVLIAYFFAQHSTLGRRIAAGFERFKKYGPVITRLTIVVALFLSSLDGAFLGPELPISQIPFAPLVKGAMLVASVSILFGVLTELAAAVAILAFLLAAATFGGYLATYANYLGEFLLLLLFGSRFLSVDGRLFGESKRLRWLKKHETAILRVFYGFALSYAAVNIKILHSQLTLDVINGFHLTKFHLLFPSDPLLAALGAALAELLIGVCIMIGFETRLVILVSLFYITLSLLFFSEQVWPHILLYGISFNLLVCPQTLSLDGFFDAKIRAWKEKRLGGSPVSAA